MRLFAYLDPGTGSIIVQAIIGAVVGAGVVVKVYWRKIRSLFGGKKTDTKQDDKKDDKKDLRD